MNEESKAKVILHLTHTDAREDARVLRSMFVGTQIQGAEVIAVGKKDSGVTYREKSDVFTFLYLNRIKSAPRHTENSKARASASHLFRISPPSREGSIRLRFPRLRGFFLWSVGYLGAIRLAFRVRKILKHHRSQRDIAIIHVHGFLMLIAGVWLKKECGAKLVYDPHEFESNTNRLSQLNSIICKLGEKIAWRSIDALVTVSPGIEREYLNTFGSRRSEIILNAPQASPNDGEGEAILGLRKLLGISETDTLAIYVGKLQTGRGIELALEAFNRLPASFKLAFVGDGPLAALIEKHSGGDNRIHLVSPVNHRNLVSFISSANLGLCLIEPVSRSDELSLPNKLFEYFAAGLPIVYSDLSEIRTFAERVNGGIVSALQSDELAKNILAITEFPPKLDLAALKNYSWENQAEKLLSLYLEIAAVSRIPSAKSWQLS